MLLASTPFALLGRNSPRSSRALTACEKRFAGIVGRRKKREEKGERE
jgi:hypothetical protein